jgi:hypothetical protein
MRTVSVAVATSKLASKRIGKTLTFTLIKDLFVEISSRGIHRPREVGAASFVGHRDREDRSGGNGCHPMFGLSVQPEDATPSLHLMAR